MNNQRTGELIAAARREKGLTQKQLASALGVSDRTVSKWERGAGFPDVSLLEPLASGLDLHILDLLRGERTEEADVHTAVAEAVSAFREEARQRRRSLRRDLAQLALLLLAAALLLAWMAPVRQKVSQTVPAELYHNGRLIARTDVEMEGEIEHALLTGERLYYGRFSIDCIPWTAEAGVLAEFYLGGSGGLAYLVRPGESTHALYDPSMLISKDMRDFAMEIRCGEGMYLLASSPAAYRDYQARRGGVPPLEALAPETLPAFPDCR